MKQILFNTENVRALLEGRKTVTRRVVKFKGGQNPAWSGYIPDGAVLYGSNNVPAAKAPYQAGDILWVRETFAVVPDGSYVYKASVECPDVWKGTWKSPYGMPREAARIFLRVTGVRVERLQEISGEDIRAEGVLGTHFKAPTRGAFVDVWDRTVKPTDLPAYGWEANPWVWVINFERISKEEAEG